MHPTKRIRRWALWGVALATLIAAGSASAQQPAPNAPVGAVDRSGATIVPLQGSVRLQMRNKKIIRSVFNTNENIVQVLADATDPRFVILFGRGVGVSRLELTDVDGGKEEYQVVVQPDIELLRNLIRRAVPTANVDAIPGIGGTVILTGNVPRAEDVDTILRIAASTSGNVVNAMSVGGVHQVQLDVTVARVDRTKLRQRAVSFGVNGTTVTFSSILGGLATLPAAQTVGPGAGAGSVLGGLQPNASANIVFGVIPANFLTALQALKTEGLAKLMAEPKLVTQSGRPARFLAGGRQATLGAASGINGPGVVYEDIGTELEFLPVVYGNGKIYLEVAPRVRGVNQGLGIVTSFGAVPGFDEQSVRTSVVLESGQTFAIGGLIQTNMQSTVAKVPVLGEIPFIGAIFSAVSQQEQETELVILVTPHLVDPMDCSQLPKRLPGAETRKPDDFELYLESLMEAPRGPRSVFAGHKYQAAWTNDPSAGEFPCYGNGGYHGSHCGEAACPTGNCAPGVAPNGSAPAALPNGVSSMGEGNGEPVQVLPVTPPSSGRSKVSSR